MTVPSQDSQFQTMYRTHRDAIWSYCVRRVHRDDVEDAVADVFIVAWKKHDRAPTGEEMLPWLYGVARNVVRNTNRSAVRRDRLSSRMRSLGSDTAEASDVQVVRNLEDERLLAAVSHLDDDDQELLRLRTWEELSINQIASAVGKSPRSVESKLGRIRKKLARQLSVPSGAQPVGPSYAEEGGER